MRPGLLALAAVGLALGLAGAPGPRAQTAPEAGVEAYPEHAGRDETFGFCTACHGFKLVSAQGMSREKWDATLDWMTERHAMPKLEGEDRAAILGYLAEAFPPKAPAADGGWKSPFAPQ